MAKADGKQVNGSSASSKRLAVGFLDSVSSLWALCARHAVRVSRRIRVESNGPRSPLARPKRFLVTMSNKAVQFRQKRKRSSSTADEFEIVRDDDFGDGGLWQKNILMGDKCQPLDFSGVIYYDSNGNQLQELPPRSPRASPLPNYLYAAAARKEEEKAR